MCIIKEIELSRFENLLKIPYNSSATTYFVKGSVCNDNVASEVISLNETIEIE